MGRWRQSRRWKGLVSEPRPSTLRLHLDADASNKALHTACMERGHDVTRTPADWMPRDASDEQQLPGATAHGRAIFTFNVRDFLVLAMQYPPQRGPFVVAGTGHSSDAGSAGMAYHYGYARIGDCGLS